MVKGHKYMSTNQNSSEWAENYAKDFLKNEQFLKTSSVNKKQEKSKNATNLKKQQDLTVHV